MDKLNEERVCSQIDFDLARISEKQQYPGWSTWALAGALGICLLRGLEIARHPQFVYESGIQVFCGFAFLFVGAAIFWYLVDPPGNEAHSRGRFNVAKSAMVGKRHHLFVVILRGVVLLIILFELFPDLNVYWRIPAIILVSIEVLFFLIILIASYFDIPVPAQQSQLDLKVAALMGTIAIVYLFLAWGLLKQSWIVTPGCSLIDWEFGGLASVSSLLIYLISEPKKQGHMVPALESLRRELTLGEISPVDAIKKYSIIQIGMEASDVLGEAVAKSLKCLENFEKSCRNICNDLDFIEQCDKDPGLSKKDQLRYKMKVKNLEKKDQVLSELAAKCDQTIARLEGRCSILVKIDGKSRDEVDSVMEKVITFGSEKMASIEHMDERIETFFEKFEKDKGGGT